MDNQKDASTSFSLFDSMPRGNLKPPANIRDFLSVSNINSFCEQCHEVNLQDLVLGFNTTQLEVQQLAKKCFEFLKLEMDTKGDTDSVLNLHEKWIKDSIIDEESISFAFLLTRNLIIASSTTTCEKDELKKYIDCVKHAIETLMSVWNDGGAYQESFLDLMYLWIQCHLMNQDLWVQWAEIDSQGILFENCGRVVNSQLKLELIWKKTGLLLHILDIVNYTLNGDTERAVDSTIGYSLCLLKTILQSTSIVNFSFPSDDSIETKQQVNFENVDRKLKWIQDIDDELQEYCNQEKLPCTPEQIHTLISPFISILKLDLTMNGGLEDVNTRTEKGSETRNSQPHIHLHLFDTCEEAITRILCGLSKNNNLLDTGAMSPFFHIVPSIPTCLKSRSSIPSSIVSYFNIIIVATEYGLHGHEKWVKAVSTFFHETIPFLIQNLVKLKGTSMNPWNTIVKFMCTCMTYSEFEAHIPKSMVQQLLKEMMKQFKNANTYNEDDLDEIYNILECMKDGKDILNEVQSASMLIDFP
ncbi:predicted protein [Chaetoceros tenuissimus]|nr:predicted protein [Chaetoceros tenuissimus]